MIRQWALFVVSILLMGLWFPAAFFRADERKFFANNFGLDSRLGDGEGDSVEEAFANVGKGPLFHSLKNILHEWTKECPKRAAKFLSFIIVVQFIFIVWRA